MSCPVASTYCRDPYAKFTVSSLSKDSGGIDGYFTSEFLAHRAAKYYRENGHWNVTVDPYNPFEESTGSNEKAMAFIRGY